MTAGQLVSSGARAVFYSMTVQRTHCLDRASKGTDQARYHCFVSSEDVYKICNYGKHCWMHHFLSTSTHAEMFAHTMLLLAD